MRAAVQIRPSFPTMCAPLNALIQLEMRNSRRDPYLVHNLGMTDLIFIATSGILPKSRIWKFPMFIRLVVLEEARRIQKLVDILGFRWPVAYH